MRLQIVLVFVAIFGILIPLIGCSDSPEMITCPDNLVTAKIGRTKANLLYELGSVLILYETDTRWKVGLMDRPPAAAVRDFFAKKGYTSTVRGYILGYEVVYLDSDVDTLPMIDDLMDLPGVEQVYLHFMSKTSELLSALSGVDDEIIVWDDDELPELPFVNNAIIEVGVLEDGSLYEFGTMIVRHDEQYTAATAVNAFFQERGYTPKFTELNSKYRAILIHVGDCVDTAPMVESLRAIPGVEDVLLNRLHTRLETFLSESDIPGVQLF
ncbi:MAG: hypothetical protein OXH39_10755 [Candidatus Poribacteria bacterium]|nr:hypothetical protein [Candidatus Poribacteria bacterium]